MHSLRQIKRSNNLSKPNQQFKKYLDIQWYETDCVEDGYYIWKNKSGVAYYKKKPYHDGGSNLFLNRSLNDSEFEVAE
jgi:hypothetical protein